MVEISGRDLLKRLAQQAKNRMRGKTNNFVSNNSKRNDLKLKTNAIIKIIDNNEDSHLYNRVKDMLNNNSDIVNPIDKIIDLNYFNNLSPSLRERYLLEMVDKYRTFKERFENEYLAKTI